MRSSEIVEPWWNADNKHDAVFQTVQRLRQNQSYLWDVFLHYLRLYSNRAACAFTGRDYGQAAITNGRIRLNIVKSCIDTATAQIGANKSRPYRQTKRGSLDLQEKVRKLDQFVLGVFHETRHYIKSLQVFKDAGIWGSGIEYWYGDGDKICCDRVPITEMVFDDHDAKYGEPRNAYMARTIDRDYLIARWPKKMAEISDAELVDYHGTTQQKDTTNPCTAIEAWHLPSGPDENDGVHTISVSTTTLEEERWDDPFPFNLWSWQEPAFGIIGTGLAEEIDPLQLEINYIAQKIQRVMNLSAGRTWLEKGANNSKISNREGEFGFYTGRPPIFQMAETLGQGYFNHLIWLVDTAFALAGVSELSATSQIPAGLESGKAIQVYHDIGARRFKHIEQRWEQYHLDAGEKALECGRRILKAGGRPRVLSVGNEKIEELDLATINVGKNLYTVNTYPASLLPEEPAGKLDNLAKLASINPNRAEEFTAMLSGAPDVDKITSLITAPQECADFYIERALSGNLEAPDPDINLELTLQRAILHKNRAIVDGVPEDRIEMLTRFIEMVKGMMQTASGPASGPMPGPSGPGPMPSGPMPPGQPMPEQPMPPQPMPPMPGGLPQ